MVWRPFYFAHLIVDPDEPRPRLQARRRADPVARTAARASPASAAAAARRLARPLDRPDEPEARHRRRRRRPLDLLRRRQPLVEGRQPADLAVLPRERRRRGPVPGLRRPAGQQLAGSATRAYPGGITNAAGRTCTAATASGCSPTRPTPTTSTPSPRAATSAASTATRTRSRDIQPKAGYKEKLRFNWNTPIAPVAEREGHDLHRRAVPVPLARPRPDLGAHLARPDHQRPAEAEAGGVGRRHRRQLRGRDAHDDLLDQRVAEGRRVRSGSAPTTATCSSRATAARPGQRRRQRHGRCRRPRG